MGNQDNGKYWKICFPTKLAFFAFLLNFQVSYEKMVCGLYASCRTQSFSIIKP